MPATDGGSAQLPTGRSEFVLPGWPRRSAASRGTIARGHLRTDLHLFTGRRSPAASAASDAAYLLGGQANPFAALTFIGMKSSGADVYVTTFPLPVTRDVLEHGRNRFMIYCVVCHDPLGTGQGTIVQRGYTRPPSYHFDRLRQVPIGHLFDVITNGYGSMPEIQESNSAARSLGHRRLYSRVAIEPAFPGQGFARRHEATMAESRQVESGKEKP